MNASEDIDYMEYFNIYISNRAYRADGTWVKLQERVL